MPYVRCILRPGISDQIAMRQLEQVGMKDLSVMTDEEGWVHLFGALPADSFKMLEAPPFVFLLDTVSPFDSTIDWDRQWADSGAPYKDGQIELDLEENGKVVLRPGPGFGDFSHSTTRMMIEMLKRHARDRFVIDIGCGSGILSLAAIALGATHCVGIDIDPEAVLHAQQNSMLNDFQEHIEFAEAKDADLSRAPEDTLYLMNMIPAEQEQALEELQPAAGEWIVSGILADRREQYLERCRDRGWELLDEVQEGEWLCLHLQNL